MSISDLDIDEDLYRLLVLGLLLLTFLALLAILRSLAQLRRALEARSATEASVSSPAGQTDPNLGFVSAAERARAERLRAEDLRLEQSGRQVGTEPAPQPAQVQPQSPASTLIREPVAQPAAEQQLAPEPARVEERAVEPTPTQPPSAAERGLAGATASHAAGAVSLSDTRDMDAASGPVASHDVHDQINPRQSTAVEAEPREQPFERDGRWWFRRGSELLVYDEGTGQWLPTPSTGAGAGGGAQAPSWTDDASVSGSSESSLTAETGTSWRCASCGTANDSGATSCRMCFAPRP